MCFWCWEIAAISKLNPFFLNPKKILRWCSLPPREPLFLSMGLRRPLWQQRKTVQSRRPRPTFLVPIDSSYKGRCLTYPGLLGQKRPTPCFWGNKNSKTEKNYPFWKSPVVIGRYSSWFISILKSDWQTWHNQKPDTLSVCRWNRRTPTYNASHLRCSNWVQRQLLAAAAAAVASATSNFLLLPSRHPLARSTSMWKPSPLKPFQWKCN